MEGLNSTIRVYHVQLRARLPFSLCFFVELTTILAYAGPIPDISLPVAPARKTRIHFLFFLNARLPLVLYGSGAKIVYHILHEYLVIIQCLLLLLTILIPNYALSTSVLFPAPSYFPSKTEFQCMKIKINYLIGIDG